MKPMRRVNPIKSLAGSGYNVKKMRRQGLTVPQMIQLRKIKRTKGDEAALDYLRKLKVRME
jgi:hypothetical protein